MNGLNIIIFFAAFRWVFLFEEATNTPLAVPWIQVFCPLDFLLSLYFVLRFFLLIPNPPSFLMSARAHGVITAVHGMLAEGNN